MRETTASVHLDLGCSREEGKTDWGKPGPVDVEFWAHPCCSAHIHACQEHTVAGALWRLLERETSFETEKAGLESPVKQMGALE